MITLTFPFRLISKDNEKIRNRQGRVFLSKKFKDFERLVQATAKQQYKGKPLTEDIACTLTVGFTNKVHCDAFNCPKGVMDALQGILYDNDRQIKCGTVTVEEGTTQDFFQVHVLNYHDTETRND